MFSLGEKGVPLKIEKKTHLNPERANKYIIDLIKDTLEEYTTEEYKTETVLPLRYTTVQLQTENGPRDIVIRIIAYKYVEGIFRKVSFEIMKS